MSKSVIHYAMALAVGCGMAANARAGECWVDVYDKTNYEGEHQRLLGPAKLPSLKAVNGEDWSNRIDSLIVGPEAELWLYKQENFKEGLRYPPNHPDALKLWQEKGVHPDDQEISFGPGQKEHHLGEMNFHNNTNSLRIECGKPR
jgi:hypothetical protein